MSIRCIYCITHFFHVCAILYTYALLHVANTACVKLYTNYTILLHTHIPLRMQVDLISIAMILSGYAVSILATKALGVDRTYFAAELGLVEPKWITEFPYGLVYVV